jgi:hypothetical protein
MAVFLAAGLLAGCETWQKAQMELGMYPVDPPRPETPLPPPGSVSQANWAAQRAAAREASNQTNTAPVGYKEPEKAVPADAAAAPAQTAMTAPASAPAPAMKPPAPAARMAAAPPAASSAAPPAAPVVLATAPALPAGYRPSPSAADDPKLAQEQQQLAAATGAQPTPPEAAPPPGLAGSMKDMAAAGISGWRAHLASHRTESAAINEWQELLRANPALYGQFDPQVEWIDTPNRGSFARLVLVGFAERKDADAACARIRSSTRYCVSVKD